MTLDYTFERQIELERKEAYQEGFEEGYREGFILGCKERGLSFEETSARVMEKFSLGDEETRKTCSCTGKNSKQELQVKP